MPRQLNEKQIAFAEAYLTNGGNGAEAYRTVYGSHIDPQIAAASANRLKKNPQIAEMLSRASAVAHEAVDRAIDRYGLDANVLADRMARLVGTELRQVCTWDSKEIRVKATHEIDDDAHQAITEVRRERDGTITVKLADKLAAMNSLARLKGWIKGGEVESNQLVVLKVER